MTLPALHGHGRLMIDPPGEGAWQMAVDEALLESASAGGAAALRFYAWSEPTLSLGYFQKYAEREQHAASRDCPLVRRPTGGGAILHDHELTYCLVVPAALAQKRRGEAWYQVVHDALIRVLAHLGVDARRLGGDAPPREDREPFLCFERRFAADVLVSGWKVCGSAQRSRRGAILQHGSLLLARSTQAPEIPGLEEIAGSLPVREALAEHWRTELASLTHIDFRPSALTAGELRAAERLVSEKYAAAAWNRRR